jgi:hypothetical protein
VISFAGFSDDFVAAFAFTAAFFSFVAYLQSLPEIFISWVDDVSAGRTVHELPDDDKERIVDVGIHQNFNEGGFGHLLKGAGHSRLCQETKEAPQPGDRERGLSGDVWVVWELRR